MFKKRVIILGAGLAGLSAAWHLKRKGVDCHIYEKEPQAGGLCRSKRINGFTFDYDGHLLHFRKRYAYNFVKRFLGGNLTRHTRRSFIRYKGQDIPYPFQGNFIKLPSGTAKECLEGLKNAGNSHDRSCLNFKEWSYQTFGAGISEHFMIPYNEKFWTIPSTELTCEWLDGFVPVLKFNDLTGKACRISKPIGYNSHFYYPKKGGIEELPIALANGISGSISLNSEITCINLAKKRVTVNNKERVHYDKLISTIPLPALKDIIKGAPQKIRNYIDILNYNSILVFNFGTKDSSLSDKHWMYFPQKSVKYFRVGFYNSFSSTLSPRGCASIYAEASYPKDSRIDEEKIKKDIIKDLIKEKIIGSSDSIIAANTTDIKYGYPIYDHHYKDSVPNILKFLSDNRIYSIGRYGRWRYMTMEDVLLDGKNITDIL